MNGQDDRLRRWPLTRAAVSGVGSLPYLRLSSALRFVAAQTPVVPFVPELPLCGGEETMRERIAAAPDRVAARNASFVRMRFPQARLVKTQVCGPFTHAAARTERIESSTKRVIARIHAELDSLGSLRTPKLVVIDEPALTSMSTRQANPVERALRIVFDVVRERGAFVGLHDCGTIDFELLGAIDPDYYSFDAWHALERVFADSTFRRWLARGRALGLGIVPTRQHAPRLSPRVGAEQLRERLACAYRGHTLDPRALPAALLSGNCGFGLSSPAWTKHAYATLHALAERMPAC